MKICDPYLFPRSVQCSKRKALIQRDDVHELAESQNTYVVVKI